MSCSTWEASWEAVAYSMVFRSSLVFMVRNLTGIPGRHYRFELKLKFLVVWW